MYLSTGSLLGSQYCAERVAWLQSPSGDGRPGIRPCRGQTASGGERPHGVQRHQVCSGALRCPSQWGTVWRLRDGLEGQPKVDGGGRGNAGGHKMTDGPVQFHGPHNGADPHLCAEAGLLGMRFFFFFCLGPPDFLLRSIDGGCCFTGEDWRSADGSEWSIDAARRCFVAIQWLRHDLCRSSSAHEWGTHPVVGGQVVERSELGRVRDAGPECHRRGS